MNVIEENLALDGVLLIDKPEGFTSHDVIAKLRGILKMKRIGHAGTLDPMATGLLIVLVGRATKLSQYLTGLRKCYEGTMKLGISTNSHDAEGEVVQTRPVTGVTLEKVEALAQTFLGDQYQLPPMFSAKKVAGKKLYDLARKGKEIERVPQLIHISEFEIDDFRGDEVDFYVNCSKGTYIRTLANDFGEKLGCGAHLTKLCRISIENFSLDDAYTLEEVESAERSALKNMLIPTYRAIPERILTAHSDNEIE